ncbi:ABC transporter substrate-binding protein [Rhodococcus artemisiae]|uniref:ABC transporter substrate-binding protein n=1 Tax=Rhodococcus artemisiae TaxID=714159 RepID=A0ABU7L4N0_9NOCA|nr:ABC transporter substrate-binding protein [Rhodococcus artemisiae]MEE2056500.1 ABC transporter substrate-binding protein [Rhodococcus artemisiae]
MKKRHIGAIAAVAALALSACSSDGGDNSAGATPSGEPIVIGALAPIKGASAYPQTAYGLEAGVHYVNEVLGGIDGRPLEVDVCGGDGSPETAISCANGFVSKGLPLVIDAVDQSMGAAVPILASAGIPIVGTLAGSFVADSAEYGQAFYFTGPVSFAALSSMSVLDTMGKTKASLAVNESPTSHAYVDDLIMPIADKMGIDVAVQYPPASGANLNVVAATQLSDDPDMAGVIALPEDGCTGLFQALRRQGYDDTILAGSCSQFIDDMGADAAGIVTQPRLWVPLAKDSAPAEVQEQLDTFADSMDAVGYGDELSSRSIYTFAALVNIAEILSGSEEITTTTVTDTFKGLRDFPTFAGPSVTCDGQQWPGVATTCNAQAIFFEVQEDGTLRSVEEAGYIDLDPSLMPTS